ncbi:hypothetical protein WJX81_005659 [Elliptochloris bilobata]|uniref:Major facilitator superfamily (MFS) profile domain-containing protein n=1 Tax=Elliptochloris bilobata TaxID=381761 RepID=A0AAW1RT76_9CHLO
MEGAAADKAANAVDGEAVLARVSRHILPLFFSLALLNSIDRANLSFAALQLNTDLGFSRSVYGFGSGLFFIGYALLQIVAPLICARVGAPSFLGTILVLWGGVTLLFAFMRTAGQFYCLRLLLGVAESGAYPGMWYHLALFFDDHELGLAYTCVATATSVAGVLGAPLAAGLLSLDGACGLRGWQWLFLVESAPAVALGLVIRWRLARSPEAALFLRPAERSWLASRKAAQPVAAEQAHSVDTHAAPPAATTDSSIWAPLLTAFASRHIWHLAGIWTLNAMGLDGIVFWAPLLVRAILDGDADAADDGATEVVADNSVTAGDTVRQLALGRMVQAALLAGVPFGAAGIAMVVNARHSKRSGERHWHGALPLLVGAVALAALAALLGSSGNGTAGAAGAFAALSAAAVGIWSVHGPLMGWPAAFLSGTTAASGFALMKMVGALGSFLGPALIGGLADATGGFAVPCLVLACCVAAGAVLMLAFRAPGGPPAAALDMKLRVAATA